MAVEEHAAGGLVVRKGKTDPLVLMILDRYGNWTLPKGAIEEGETPGQAALREIEEETGVKGDIVCPINTVRYQYEDSRGLVQKSVDFFLIQAKTESVTPREGEIVDAAWLIWNEALNRSGYDNMVPVFSEGKTLVSEEM